MKKIRMILRMLRLIGRFAPGRLAAVTAARMFSRTFGMFYALFFLRHIINQLTQRRPLWELLVFIGLFGLWDFVGLVIRAWVEQDYIPRSNQRINHALDELVFEKLQQTDLAQFETPEFYDQLAVMAREFKPKFRELVENTADLLTACWQFAVSVAVLMQIDPSILLFVLPILVSFRLEARHADRSVEMQKAAAPAERRAGYVRSTMSDRRTVGDLRLTNVFSVLEEIFETAVTGLKANVRAYGPRVAWLRFCTELTAWIIPHVSMHLYTARRMMTTDLYTLGDFATVSNGIYNVTGALYDSLEMTDKLAKLSAYGENFFVFLERGSELVSGDETPRFEQVLTVESLTFRYPGSETPVIDGASFTLHRGETVAVTGYNGAGKSTLVKLLLHLYEPQEGCIRADGVDIRRCRLDAYRALFGCCFQDGQIYALPIRDNILAGADGDLRQAVDRAEARSAIEKASPHGADAVMTREFDDDGVVLSGGERQKILAARAYAANAPIMIFDEPTANLDPLAEYDFFESLVRMSKEKTLVFISHRLSAAQLADRILFMEHGRITEMGSHEELMRLGGKYADMYLKQASSYIETEVRA